MTERPLGMKPCGRLQHMSGQGANHDPRPAFYFSTFTE
jgi:hypothetical protein